MADDNLQTETLAETENYIAWRATEPDRETTFHLELGHITVHFFEEEWQELITLFHGLLEAMG